MIQLGQIKKYKLNDYGELLYVISTTQSYVGKLIMY
jgi:hypothetical protein